MDCYLCGPTNGEMWVEHLIRKPHRRRSRKQFELVGWTREQMACSLIIFSSFPLINSVNGSSGVITLLQKCGSGINDLVSWDEKPNIGIIQFITRGKMFDALRDLEAVEWEEHFKIKLDDAHVLTVRRLKFVSDLELCILLPERKQVPPQPTAQPLKYSQNKVEDDVFPVTTIEDKNDNGDVGNPLPPGMLSLDNDAEADTELIVLTDDEVDVDGMALSTKKFVINPDLPTKSCQVSTGKTAKKLSPRSKRNLVKMKNALICLSEYAHLRRWPAPMFIRNYPRPTNAYLYDVELNGKRFNVHRSIGEADTEEKAKLNSAAFVWEMLSCYP